jgi:hypothetical protein
VVFGRDSDAATGVEEVVAEVAVAGQPHAAFQHGELPATAPEAPGMARQHPQPAVGDCLGRACLHLRFHHQSPVILWL